MKSHRLQKESVEPAAPYTVLASVYDQMMAHVNYRRWASYVASIMKKEGTWLQGDLLDIGCGTGRFLGEMFNKKHPGYGCDPSPAMLSVAKKHLPAKKFYQCGLPELEKVPNERFSTITCLYDTMNYLMEEQEFVKALLSVYRKLLPGGIFIFDLVSEAHCQLHFQNYHDSEVLNDDYAYQRETYYDSQKKIQFNWVRIYSPEGIFEEEHQQRIYDFSQVQRNIARYTAFSLVHIYSDFSFDKANRNSGRAHFVLKKKPTNEPVSEPPLRI